MVELYRAPDSPEADTIADALQNMTIERSVTTVETEDDLPDDASFAIEDLPVLIDDGDVIIEPNAIENRLEKLEALMADWYRFQSDTCELDAEGNVC
jgi:lipoate synthase